MAQRFSNGTIYLDSETKVSELYVSDRGLVISKSAYECAETKEDVDLAGKTLLPAFRDAHIHPLLGGREALGLDVKHAGTTAELGALLKEHLAKSPGLKWLDAGTYNRGIDGPQTSATLDKYVDTIPVILHADDHHTIWVNSKAMEVAGITQDDVPSFPIGGFDIDSEGIPTGLVRESLAKDTILKHAPKRSLQDDVQALLKAESMLIEAGIVEVQDAWVNDQILAAYLRAQPQLKLDYKLAFSMESQSLDSDIRFISTAVNQLDSNLQIRPHSVKIFVDGVFGSATAFVTEPYLTTQTTGDLNWTKEKLESALIFAKDLGLQAHLHAIGDAAVAFALDSIESTQLTNSVIAHAELTTAALLKRASALGVTMCVQPYWAQRNDLLLTCTHHLGEQRLESLYSFRSMLDNGIPLVFSSDWPVSSHKPLEGIATAVFRRLRPDQKPHNLSEAITIQEAVSTYTSSVATLLSSGTGTLKQGSEFDAVVLNMDLMQKDLEGFSSLEVLAVYKRGITLLPHNHN